MVRAIVLALGPAWMIHASIQNTQRYLNATDKELRSPAPDRVRLAAGARNPLNLEFVWTAA
jgi:hypothetical protein